MLLHPVGGGAALVWQAAHMRHALGRGCEQPSCHVASADSHFATSRQAQVLTTSNITEAIDLAFVDRADIKAYIGNPNEQAR